MSGFDKELRQRVSLVGETLRQGVETPTDTYITEDIPLLLTRLSRVPPIPPRGDGRADVDKSEPCAQDSRQEAS